MKKASLLVISALLLSLPFLSCSKESDMEDEEEEPPVSYADVTFYITKAPGCESISISFQTEDRTRTLYSNILKTNLTTGAPSCGMTSGFTFRNVAYGKYKFVASCGMRTLNGDITVDKECVMKLLD